MDDDRARARLGEALCLQCGLCCDGTLFGSVVVEEGERERLGRARLRIVEADGRPAMPQPCTALKDCRCEAYADRPNACRRYSCTLLERLLAGEVGEGAAQASVLRMRVLLATVRGSLDLPETASLWQAILALEEPGASDPRSDPTSRARRRIDEGIAAAGELIELARAVFEPKFAGGGAR